MLILFDVDATLLTTSRAGIAAMGHAGRALFGPSFSEHTVEYAGRLDPLIIVDLLRAHGVEPSPAEVTRFRAGYRDHLRALLASGDLARPCAGVPALLAALRERSTAVVGLLTGNFPETGAIKLRAAGIEPDDFPIQVWGDDSPHHPPAREHLPAVGLARYRARYERAIVGADITIVGDTPHDIACARAHGCRSLGVATGMFGVEQLVAAGADHAVKDLSSTQEIVRWLLSPASSPG